MKFRLSNLKLKGCFIFSIQSFQKLPHDICIFLKGDFSIWVGIKFLHLKINGIFSDFNSSFLVGCLHNNLKFGPVNGSISVLVILLENILVDLLSHIWYIKNDEITIIANSINFLLCSFLKTWKFLPMPDVSILVFLLWLLLLIISTNSRWFVLCWKSTCELCLTQLPFEFFYLLITT